MSVYSCWHNGYNSSALSVAPNDAEQVEAASAVEAARKFVELNPFLDGNDYVLIGVRCENGERFIVGCDIETFVEVQDANIVAKFAAETGIGAKS